MKNDRSFLPAASVLAAGIFWGCISLFVNPLSEAGAGSLQIALLRMIFSVLILGLFLLIKNPSCLRIRLRDLWMFIGTGIVSLTLFNTFYFYTMTEGEVSVAVVLLYTSPVFIMLLSRVLFKEMITRRKIAALILTIGGCVLVSGLLGGPVRIPGKILLTGIASGLFYGLYTIFGKYALAKYDSVTVTFYTFFFALLGGLIAGKPAATVKLLAGQPKLILLGLGIALFCTVLPYFFYTWGLTRMDSGKAAILVAVEPLMGALLGIAVYHEDCGLLKVLGIACILSAILLLGRDEPKDK